MAKELTNEDVIRELIEDEQPAMTSTTKEDGSVTEDVEAEEIPEVEKGPDQIKADNYEEFDYSKKPFSDTTLGKLLKPLTFIFYPVAWVVLALRNVLVTFGMDKASKQKYFKNMEEEAQIAREKARKETPYVANNKMAIIKKYDEQIKALGPIDTEEKNKQRQLILTEEVKELALLSHTSGKTFYIVLQDKSAIEFRATDKYVEMCFSNPPQRVGNDKYESYTFGTVFGNIRYSTTGQVINSTKARSVNINTVLARINERGGIDPELDTLKQNAVVKELSTFTNKRNKIDIINAPEGVNPGHENDGYNDRLTKEEKIQLLGGDTPFLPERVAEEQFVALATIDNQDYYIIGTSEKDATICPVEFKEDGKVKYDPEKGDILKIENGESLEDIVKEKYPNSKIEINQPYTIKDEDLERCVNAQAIITKEIEKKAEEISKPVQEEISTKIVENVKNKETKTPEKKEIEDSTLEEVSEKPQTKTVKKTKTVTTQKYEDRHGNTVNANDLSDRDKVNPKKTTKKTQTQEELEH